MMAARSVPLMPAFFAGQKLTGTLMNTLGAYSVFWASPPSFRMTQSAAQSIPNNTATQVTMNNGTGAGVWDSDGGRVAVTPYSYIIPVGMSGRWRFAWCVAWPLNSTGARVAILYQNGVAATGDTDDVAANNDFTSEIATATVAVSAGDTMAVYAYQNSGGALSTAANTQFASFFEGQLVSLGNP